jgi:hypothetical protein
MIKRGQLADERDRAALAGAARDIVRDGARDLSVVLSATELSSVLRISARGADVTSQRDRGLALGGAGSSALCNRVALRAQAALAAGGPSDLILEELITRCLLSPNLDERLYLGMVIAATPYRQPVIDALVAEVQTGLLGQHEPLCLSLFQMLTVLNSTRHDGLVRRFLLDPAASAQVRLSVARSMPHAAAVISEQDCARMFGFQLRHHLQRPTSTQEAVLHAIAYGSATSGHRGLLSQIIGDPSVPDRVRVSARWWHHAGTAFRR